ncbi:MAG: hypothetical protein SFU25_04480 [Candidatus Caenarcaniphilales bacterium]|nr:hypothetical protein [Candidatus Caenarcaniphilales bacterium]
MTSIYDPHLVQSLRANEILSSDEWKNRRINNQGEGNFDFKEEAQKTIQQNIDKSKYIDAYLFEGGIQRPDWIVMFHKNGNYDVITSSGELTAYERGKENFIQNNIGVSFTSDGISYGFNSKYTVINPSSSFPAQEERFLQNGFANLLTKENIEKTFTSLASLQINDADCSASRLENSSVLETAQHCVEDLDGTSGLQESDSLKLNSNAQKISFGGFTLADGYIIRQKTNDISKLGTNLQITSTGTDSVLISSNTESVQRIQNEKTRDSQLLREAAKTNEALPAILYSANPSFTASPIIVFPGIKESDLKPNGSPNLTLAVAVPVEFYGQIAGLNNIPKLIQPKGNDETFLNGQSGGKVQVALGGLEKAEGVIN